MFRTQLQHRAYSVLGHSETKQSKSFASLHDFVMGNDIDV
jgi:hypothetical protein